MEIRYTIGANVRRLRILKRMSLTELAVVVDIDTGYLSKIELGKCEPKADLLDRLAQGLNASMDDVFNFDVKNLPPDDPTRTRLLRLHRRLRELPEEKRAAVLRVLEQIVLLTEEGPRK